MPLEFTHIPLKLLTKPETDRPCIHPGFSLTSMRGALLPSSALLNHDAPACCWALPPCCASAEPRAAPSPASPATIAAARSNPERFLSMGLIPTPLAKLVAACRAAHRVATR